jgi:hypothetical protein
MPKPTGVDADALARELVKRLLIYIATHHRGNTAVLKSRRIKRILEMNVSSKVLSRMYRILETGYGFKVVSMRRSGRRPLYAVVIDMNNPVIRELRATPSPQ